MNLATQIVVGSREIDRMKDEILIVINTIAGLIDESDKQNGNIRIEFAIGTSLWIFESWPKQPTDNGLMVRCFSPEGNDSTRERCWAMICPGTREGLRLRYEDVGYVYIQLNAFVQEMVVRFPVLEGRLKPLIDAAVRKYRFD